jgi:DNA repair exonuclease SbcCD nuclease subunit
MIKVYHINDLHIGLTTESIDRTPEIINVSREAIKQAVKSKKEGFKTYFVIGGDVFNTNTPSEKLINAFISGILNPLQKYGIDTFIVAGNHDSIAEPDRLSCLSFIHSIKERYNHITLIDDLTYIPVADTDFGPLNFIFLPHVTRAHLEKDDRKDMYKNTQDYIESFALDSKKKIGKENNYIFSHLNVRGAHGGSEENLLKKSEAYLPECFLVNDIGFTRPQIIQSHIHSKQVINNINIVGSQIFCGFGEAETEKHFLELCVPTNMGEKEEFNYIPTSCVQFKQLELNLTEGWDKASFVRLPEVQTFLSKIDRKSKTVIKFDVTVKASSSSTDWENIRVSLQTGTNWIVKPIVPRYVSHRILRSSKQKINLNPDDAIKTFLKTNKPDRIKQKYAIAKRYL